ncbi:MAG: exosortase A [Rhodoferax sp.]|nr:exosortase A [Rhodoferax sp.]NCP53980.1 exosortase A [Rhodoferax sp.]PIW09473.1 MAG: exosortase A [Comamonadaceae bacterium CG17_big_fil_post_rev_8_21_14_2_50_60_13]PJC14084.1 MAG: exosortase A [Comamonadaceae bacterium CG_4_9_14_0_8_um_filter_60_18]
MNATAPATLTPTPNWPRYAGALVLLLAWALFLFFDTASAMVGIWLRSDTFTHGFVVVPIVLWLVWHKRATLAQLPPQPNPWALPLLALVAFAWLLGDLVAINALTQLALVAMLVLLVPALLGLPVTRVLGFALAFLFFAVPFGEFAMPQLMNWTADFTVMALRTSGIPVYREGLQFVIPSGNWSVIEACSGVRYLIASLTVGVLFAYLNYQSTLRRVLFIAVSIVVPVIANWLRAYMIVMLGHLSGNKLAAGVDHLIYGWVFFGIVILLMFMVGARWAEPEPAIVLRADQDPSSPETLAHSDFARLVGVSVIAALLLAAPQGARWALEHSTNAAEVKLQAPAQLAPGWSVATEPPPAFTPAFQNPSAAINTSYTSGADKVGLYLGYYRAQNYQRKLVSSDNVLVKSKDPQWALVASASAQVNFADHAVSLRQAELRGSSLLGQAADDRLLAWQLYWVNGKLTASNVQAKAYGALYRLLGRGDDSAVIVLTTAKGPQGEGQARLQAFVQANASALIHLLEQTRRDGQQ